MSGKHPYILMLFLRIEYRSGVPEQGVFPLVRVTGELADRLLAGNSEFVLARLNTPATTVFCDALALPEYADGLLRAIHEARLIRLPEGELVTTPLVDFVVPPLLTEAPPIVQRTERNNYSINYRAELLLKVLRRLDEEPNSDLEVTQFLAGRFPHTPLVVGHLDYRHRSRRPCGPAQARSRGRNRGVAGARRRA